MTFKLKLDTQVAVNLIKIGEDEHSEGGIVGRRPRAGKFSSCDLLWLPKVKCIVWGTGQGIYSSMLLLIVHVSNQLINIS